MLRFLLHPGQYLQNECESQRVPRLIKGWIEVPASLQMYIFWIDPFGPNYHTYVCSKVPKHAKFYQKKKRTQKTFLYAV